jgi:transposase
LSLIKKGKGKKGSLVASIKVALSKDIITVLEKLPLELRNTVKEVTLDMANNMESAARQSFAESKLVIDRFHVVKLAMDVLQHLRIKYRWAELDIENEAIEACKKQKIRYKADVLENGDTPKQLLARSRYILTKHPNKWTASQQQRASLPFNRYPALNEAYRHVLEIRNMYKCRNQDLAEHRFKEWINKINTLKIKEFNTVANTVKHNLNNILNFFINRSTNANAEYFNSKIKLFRANQRGVVDTKFFLFRLLNFLPSPQKIDVSQIIFNCVEIFTQYCNIRYRYKSYDNKVYVCESN